MTKKISIVTPTFNEQDNIKNFIDLAIKEIDKLNYDYEIIIIDNHSNDNTQKTIRKIIKEHDKVKAIFNARNFGSIRSSHHAILQTSGDAVILMSSDLQEPISLIPEYLKYWEEGYDSVMGQRTMMKSRSILSMVRKLFYKSINSISEIQHIEESGSTCLISKKIVEQFRLINDPYPYFRGLIPEVTSNIKIITYIESERKSGKTKSNFFVLYDHAMLGIVKHSKAPLRIATIFGFFCSSVSILIALCFFLYKVFFWSEFQVGVAPLIIGLFGIASIQLFLLGFVGEYVMQILTEVRKMPLVIEKERINF